MATHDTKAKLISSIQLPNDTTKYEIHDAKAFHTLADLGLSSPLDFKGVKSTYAEITSITSAKVGDVYKCTENDTEYVCVVTIDGTANTNAWEEFGPAHNYATSTHTHNVTVTGKNNASTVTGSVTIPTVSATEGYLSGTAAAQTLTKNTDSVLGSNTTFTVTGGDADVSTTKLSATVTGMAVAGNGTAKAITALGTPSTAAAITALNTATVKNPTVTAGTQASWTAEVDSTGCLTFAWTANSPTVVTTSDVTVATGAKTTANTITGFGTHTTKDCLTGVKVSTQPTVTIKSGSTGDVSVATGVTNGEISVVASGDPVNAITEISANSSVVTLKHNTSTTTGAVAYVKDISIGSSTADIANGQAAAQTWSQSTGTTGSPK